MSRHIRACIKRNFGYVVTETPFDAAWVVAIKEIIPQNARKYEDGNVWSFDPRYFNAVKTITEHYHGSVIDSTGGVPEIQVLGWKEKWEVFKELDRKANKEEKQHWQSRGGKTPKPASSAFAALFVTENAPKEVINAAIRALRVKFHPDTGGDNEIMARINAAYDELKKKGVV